MLNVQLLAFTPQPEQTVAAAARLCYSPSTIDELMDGMTEEKTASFVDMLAEIGHESPIVWYRRGIPFVAGADHAPPSGLLQCAEPAVCGGGSL